MQLARENVRAALNEARAPVILSSFGKDSLLLTALVREVDKSVPILWFKSASTPEQAEFARSVIRQWELDVYSYEPADVYLLANNDERTVVQEYSFGDDRLPVAIDLSEGERCLLTAFPTKPKLTVPFDTLFVGYKDCDTHWLKNDSELFPMNYTLGPAKVVAPIRHLTDEVVRSAVTELPLNYRELDDRVSMCTACMTHTSDEVWCPAERRYISRVQWEQQESLTAFRQRFNLNGGPHQ